MITIKCVVLVSVVVISLAVLSPLLSRRQRSRGKRQLFAHYDRCKYAGWDGEYDMKDEEADEAIDEKDYQAFIKDDERVHDYYINTENLYPIVIMYAPTTPPPNITQYQKKTTSITATGTFFTRTGTGDVWTAPFYDERTELEIGTDSGVTEKPTTTPALTFGEFPDTTMPSTVAEITQPPFKPPIPIPELPSGVTLEDTLPNVPGISTFIYWNTSYRPILTFPGGMSTYILWHTSTRPILTFPGGMSTYVYWNTTPRPDITLPHIPFTGTTLETLPLEVTDVVEDVTFRRKRSEEDVADAAQKIEDFFAIQDIGYVPPNYHDPSLQQSTTESTTRYRPPYDHRYVAQKLNRQQTEALDHFQWVFNEPTKITAAVQNNDNEKYDWLEKEQAQLTTEEEETSTTELETSTTELDTSPTELDTSTTELDTSTTTTSSSTTSEMKTENTNNLNTDKMEENSAWFQERKVNGTKFIKIERKINLLLRQLSDFNGQLNLSEIEEVQRKFRNTKNDTSVTKTLREIQILTLLDQLSLVKNLFNTSEFCGERYFEEHKRTTVVIEYNSVPEVRRAESRSFNGSFSVEEMMKVIQKMLKEKTNEKVVYTEQEQTIASLIKILIQISSHNDSNCECKGQYTTDFGEEMAVEGRKQEIIEITSPPPENDALKKHMFQVLRQYFTAKYFPAIQMMKRLGVTKEKCGINMRNYPENRMKYDDNLDSLQKTTKQIVKNNPTVDYKKELLGLLIDVMSNNKNVGLLKQNLHKMMNTGAGNTRISNFRTAGTRRRKSKSKRLYKHTNSDVINQKLKRKIRTRSTSRKRLTSVIYLERQYDDEYSDEEESNDFNTTTSAENKISSIKTTKNSNTPTNSNVFDSSTAVLTSNSTIITTATTPSLVNNTTIIINTTLPCYHITTNAVFSSDATLTNTTPNFTKTNPQTTFSTASKYETVNYTTNNDITTLNTQNNITEYLQVETKGSSRFEIYSTAVNSQNFSRNNDETTEISHSVNENFTDNFKILKNTSSSNQQRDGTKTGTFYPNFILINSKTTAIVNKSVDLIEQSTNNIDKTISIDDASESITDIKKRTISLESIDDPSESIADIKKGTISLVSIKMEENQNSNNSGNSTDDDDIKSTKKSRRGPIRVTTTELNN